MSKTIEVLTKARALLETAGWTKGEGARDKSGCWAYPTDQAAVCFCAIGALVRASHELKYPPGAIDNAHTALSRVVPGDYASVSHFNDSQQSSGPVLWLFSRAIDAESK